MDLGRHIVVYGPTGSGKTTVSRAIGERLELPVVELDALFWRQSGWEEPPVEEFRERVLSHLHGLSGWVCDGNYSMLRPEILPMADSLVWLRLPFHTVYWQLLKRQFRYLLHNEVLWGTNRDSWKRALSLGFLFIYLATTWRRYRTGIQSSLREIPHHAHLIELRSRREVREFLDGLG